MCTNDFRLWPAPVPLLLPAPSGSSSAFEYHKGKRDTQSANEVSQTSLTVGPLWTGTASTPATIAMMSRGPTRRHRSTMRRSRPPICCLEQ